MELCAKSQFDCVQFPTVRQAFDIYASYSGNECNTIAVVKSRINVALQLIGASWDDNLSALTYKRLKDMVAGLQAKGSSSASVKGTLNAFKAITNDRLRDQLDEMGLTRFVLDIPCVEVKHNEVIGMTDAQKVDVDQLIFNLRNSMKPSDREMFKALFFERMLAMRPGDINRLKWRDVIGAGGRFVLKYKPHKTARKTGRTSNIVLSARLVEMIRPFVGEPDAYVITRKCNDAAKKHGYYSGGNRAFWKRINAWYREHGITDGFKASYLNRRQRITEANEHGGFRESCAIGMNTPKVQVKSYLVSTEVVAA